MKWNDDINNDGDECVQDAAEKPGIVRRIIGFPSLVVLNFIVIAIIGVTGVGLGSWASIYNLKLQVKTFGLFQSCYQC